jgi:hypothetical protein
MVRIAEQRHAFPSLSTGMGPKPLSHIIGGTASSRGFERFFANYVPLAFYAGFPWDRSASTKVD